MNPPTGSINPRTCLRVASYGAMGAHIAMPPFFVISEATYPMRRMLMSRCSLENPSSEDRFLRTRSPSNRVTGRPPVSRNLVSNTLAMVGARDVQDARPFGYLVSGEIFVLIFEVDHHVERHHGDADFRFVLLEDFLGLVGTVERLAIGVLARTGVVAAHDKVATTVVLANQSVPDGLAGSTHAHGQGQQGKLHRS